MKKLDGLMVFICLSLLINSWSNSVIFYPDSREQIIESQALTASFTYTTKILVKVVRSFSHIN
jgi:hypothetical protein